MTAAELIFKIQATGTDELKKVAVAVSSVGEGTRLAGAQLKTFDATLNSLVASGKTFQQALEEMARSEGVLSNAVRSTAGELLKQLPAVKEAEAAALKLAEAKKAAAKAEAELAAANKAGLLSLQQLGYGTGVVNYQVLNLARGFSGLVSTVGIAGTALIAVAAGLTLGGVAAFEMVKSAGAAEREIANLAIRLGLTVQQAEKLSAEADLVGVNINGLEAAARLLGEALAHPDEQGKKTAKSLSELGISTMDVKGHMVELGPVVLQVLEKLSQIPDQATRAALGQELLGRSSKVLQPLIDKYQELKALTGDIGTSPHLSSELLDADSAVKKLDQSWSQFWKRFTGNIVAPVATPVINALTAGISHHAPYLGPGLNFGTNAALGIHPDVAATLAAPPADTRDKADAAKFSAAHDNTKEGLEEQLSAAKKKEQEMAALLSGGQLDKATFDKDKGDYDKTVAEITRIQKTLDSIKEVKKEGKKQDQETIALQEELGRLQAKELTGLDAILAKHNAKLHALEEENKLNPVNRYLEDTIFATEKQIYSSPAELEKARNTADKAVAAGSKPGDRAEEKDIKELLGGLDKALEPALKKFKDDQASAEHVQQRADQTSADAVRRQLDVTVRENSKGTGNGERLSGSQASNANYQARVAAATQIFQIETKHLGLIEDEGKRADALADARKKAADEIFNAEKTHAEELDAIRTADLNKYHTFAESIFTALTDRVRGTGFDLRQMLRSDAKSLGSQVFANATQSVFQAGGHALAGLSGGFNPGGILNGTFLDPKGKAADKYQADTVKNTKGTWDEVNKLRMLLTGNVDTTNGTAIDQSTALGGSAATAATAASTAAALPLGLTGGSNTAAMVAASLGLGGSAITAGTGTAALAALGIGGGSILSSSSSGSSGIVGMLSKALGMSGNGAGGNFSAGVGSVLSGNALSILMGQNTTGPTTLSGQIGAGVGLAGALAGSTFGVVQGLQQGGVAGGLKAAGGAVGLATTLTSNIAPLLGAVLPAALPIIGSVIAAALPLIGSLFGSNPQIRANQITNELAQNQFLAPTALNVTQGMNGTLEDFDSRGLLRTSTLSALPTVAEPYITSERLNGSPYRTYQDSPGGQIQNYSGNATGTGVAPISNVGAGGSGPTTIVNVAGDLHAMDAQSFHEYMQRPASSAAVGDSLASHLQTTEGRASNAIRFITQ